MDTIGSRDIAQEVALRHWQPAADFRSYMPITQHWIRSNLFEVAGVGAVEQNPRRGKSRRFPIEALRWARLFSAMSNRGTSTSEIEYVVGALHQRFRGEVNDALAGRGDDVWCIYGSAPPLSYVEGLHIQRGGVQQLSGAADRGLVPPILTAINLTQAFK